MVRRLQALFMLILFGLVLPAAGSPQRFCTRALTFVSQDCCCAKKHCGHCPDSKTPVKPSCVASAKVFPDGVNPESLSLPPVCGFVLPAFVLPEPATTLLPAIAPSAARDRGPPDGMPPVYLSHRSLLI